MVYLITSIPGHRSWVGLGGVGRQLQQQYFTMNLYSDVQNVLGWLCDHLQNRLLRDTNYTSRVWHELEAIVYCNLAGKLPRKALLEYKLQ